jgi:ribosomal protein L40E
LGHNKDEIIVKEYTMAKKICPQCNLKVGVRTKRCPDCDFKFHIRKGQPRPKQIDWTELKSGDIIKSVQGHGDYFINNSGEKSSMAYTGKYTVSQVTKDGICAYPYKNKTESGFCFIYMGKPKYSKETGIYNQPHKILGIQTEATVIEKKSKKKKRKKINVNEINELISSL